MHSKVVIIYNSTQSVSYTHLDVYKRQDMFLNRYATEYSSSENANVTI